ncbi:effector-associated domain EAD1-containing protein [Streptosporangium sp. H16]|uniref:effector-associated domain EAD1-containing protein n=1 Tax=Streptosporangium sp. H16 TaxID=3444184 RepID=UPI003F7916C9
MRRGPGDGEGPRAQDIHLTPDSRDIFLEALASAFGNSREANHILEAIGFPMASVPGFDRPFDFWNDVFREFNRGIMPTPYRLLLNASLRRYGHNAGFTRVAAACGLTTGGTGAGTGAGIGTREDPPACHVIVRADSESERRATARWLTAEGLEPREVWSTPTAVSYRLGETDPGAVRLALENRPDLGWTVVPPGAPDYLIHHIYVEGPDGRRFSVTDAPAQQTVGNLAEEIVEQYRENGGLPSGDRPTVVDKVGPAGQGERTNPDNTLHEEGIGEDDLLRVGFQATAAAINPLDRQDALSRARNQIRAYARARPGFVVRSNSTELPTEYEIRFEGRSFGPPVSRETEPLDIGHHIVSILLCTQFPLTAPQVFWESPIFHPNVFPTYECEALRRRPHMQGLVCLGTLAESYSPSLDFGELCATLRDIAGFRNYSVFVLSEDLDAGGPRIRGDYYDEEAALWAVSLTGQERIQKIGGMMAFSAPRAPGHYRNVISPDA